MEACREDLKPKYIMQYLLEAKVFTEEESEDILSLESSSQQVDKLFEILLKKSSKEFNNFIKVLEGEDHLGGNYPWLGEKLRRTDYYNLKQETVMNLSENVLKLLTHGGVPFQNNRFLYRKDKVETVRDKLRWAVVRKRHWVVLHGMTGTGKSLLAIEAVRNNDIIVKHFPEGVCWISIGNIKDSSALGIKIKKLFKFLDSEEKYFSAAENIHELTDSLKNIVFGKKMLVILDDVWENKEADVIKVFDIGCPILVTTKFKGVFDTYSDFTSLIPCGNDFDTPECKTLLSLYVNCETSELPPEVDSICKKCKKSPFIVSHIGSWMAPYGNNIQRWKHLKDLLESGLTPMRHRHSSGDEMKEIKEIIRLTLETIEPIEEYRDYYLDFAIFPEDVFVPVEVFAVLWDKAVFDVQDIMYKLIRASLLHYEMDPDQNYSYGIHDLYLDILKDICKNEQERHLKLVNSFLKRCKTPDGSYEFSLLQDDNYIHYYIGYHIYNSGDNSLLDGKVIDDIYFDLKFVERKLQLDPRDLLVDYQNYADRFQDKEQLEEFKAFARKNAHLCYSNPDCDIIQLGLFEPKGSVIYEKAQALALKSQTKSYFHWCNQEENGTHVSNLTAKPSHVQNLRHAAISSDGLLIACATGKIVSIYIICTGEEYRQLTGHSKAVNYCVFNSSRSKVLTASDDKTVKIFEIPLFSPGMKPAKKRVSVPVIDVELSQTPDLSLLSFNQHFCEVKCCNFSPEEDLAVSSDVFGCVHIWQSSTADPKLHVYHTVKEKDNDVSIYPVENCCFNNHGTLFGSAAYDSIKIWRVETGENVGLFLHTDMAVKGFCFTQDDSVISVADRNIYKENQRPVLKCSNNLVITCCCLSLDGNYLACGTSEYSVLVYLTSTWKLINELKGHRKDVLSVMFTEDSEKLLLLSLSEDRYIVHDMSQVRNTSMVSFKGILGVKQNSNDLIIVSSDYFNCLEIRKGITGKLHCKTDSDDSDITACSVSDDCTEVVYGTHSGDLKVFNIQNKTLDALTKHDGRINYITHAKNIFFTCSEDDTLRVWNKGSYIKLKGHSQSVLMCVPFRTCEQVLSCSKDGTLRVWEYDLNNNSGVTIVITEGHGNYDVRYCDISFDEKFIASASADRTVKVWFAKNGTLYKTLFCTSEVKCCRFSPKVQVLVVGCDSGEVVRWQIGPKPVSDEVYKHSSCVYNIYFNKNGSQFASIGNDIKIWSPGKNDVQTLLLPSSLIEETHPYMWASDNFDMFIVIHCSVLYVLKKITHTSIISHY